MSVNTDADPKAVGTAIETATIDALEALAAVPDEEVEWHDARLTAPLTSSGACRVLGHVRIPAGRPVEIKATQRRVSNGAAGDQRGRWYIKQDAHQQLIQAGGVYVFVVYDDSGATQARVAVPADAVGVAVGSWSDVSASWGDAAVAKLAWSRFVAPGRVDGEGGEPA